MNVESAPACSETFFFLSLSCTHGICDHVKIVRLLGGAVGDLRCDEKRFNTSRVFG